MGHEIGRATLRLISIRQPRLSSNANQQSLSLIFDAVFTMRFPLKNTLTLFCRMVIQTAVRMLVTFLVFGVCLVITLRWFGIPLPSLHEMLHSFDGVSELARILS